MSAEKQERIESLQGYMEANGISVDDLLAMQKGQSEVKENPVLQPQDIAGVSNDPCLSNAELTSKLAALKATVDNLAVGLSQLTDRIRLGN